MRIMSKALAGLVLASLTATPASAALISEFRPDPPGLDPSTQTIELSGVAGTTFDGFVLSVNGTAGSQRLGTVETASTLSGMFDPNGLFTKQIADLENPAHTILITDTFTGDVDQPTNTDIDTNNDGIADNVNAFQRLDGSSGVQDALGVADGFDLSNRLYGAQLGGQDFQTTGDRPQLAFRDASTGDWYAINDPTNNNVYNIDGDTIDPALFNSDPFSTTFGEINPSIAAVPEPNSVALIALGSLAYGVRRRRRRSAAKQPIA